jgi:hypothetical protein
MLPFTGYDSSTYQIFHEYLQRYFSGALPMEDYMKKTFHYCIVLLGT